MNTRTAFHYAAPTTLAAIIRDAFVCINGDEDPKYSDAQDVKEIVTDAWSVLVANAGTEDAMDELLQVGIGPDEMDWIWS